MLRQGVHCLQRSAEKQAVHTNRNLHANTIASYWSAFLGTLHAAHRDRKIKENAALIQQMAGQKEKMKAMEQEYRSLSGQSSERQKRLEVTIGRQQAEIDRLHKVIEEKDNQIAHLDRLAHPQRYRLSSGAELGHIFVPNYLNPSLHIWTKVGEERFEAKKYSVPDDTAQKHLRGELTDEEFVNAVFDPQEQVSGAQAQLLGAAFMLATGGPAQAHVGTGSGGTKSDLPWREKKKTSPRR